MMMMKRRRRMMKRRKLSTKFLSFKPKNKPRNFSLMFEPLNESFLNSKLCILLLLVSKFRLPNE